MPDSNRTCLDCERTDLWGKWCCQPHYRARLKAGTLPRNPTTEERFWSHVKKSDGCWIWTSAVRRRYGRFAVSTGKQVSAHRFSYELVHGAIDPSMTIDHLCQNTLCVNPDHMEVVTLLENIHRRPPTDLHPNKVKTHCPQGHPYDKFVRDDAGNIVERRCWTCDRRYWKDAAQRKKVRALLRCHK